MRRLTLQSLTFTVLLLSVPVFVWAAGTASLTGHITDPQGASVQGAVVTLFDRDSNVRFTVTSDLAGVYRFERLQPGEYLLQVESPGLAQSSVQTVRLEGAQQAVLDVVLGMAVHRDEVVVTPSGTPQPVDEVSKAIGIVDEREIEERDEYSVAEALR